MTTTGWPKHPDPAALRAAGSSNRAAGFGLLLVSAVMTAWVVVGLIHIARFDRTADQLFGTVAFADDDYAVAIVQLTYGAVFLLAVALAIVTHLVGWAVLGNRRRARAATNTIGVFLIAFSVKVFLLDFVARIAVPQTGISNHLYRHSMHQFNQLNPWRLEAWFHIFSVAAGVLTIVVVLASWYLLGKSGPKSRLYY